MHGDLEQISNELFNPYLESQEYNIPQEVKGALLLSYDSPGPARMKEFTQRKRGSAPKFTHNLQNNPAKYSSILQKKSTKFSAKHNDWKCSNQKDVQAFNCHDLVLWFNLIWDWV